MASSSSTLYLDIVAKILSHPPSTSYSKRKRSHNHVASDIDSSNGGQGEISHANGHVAGNANSDSNATDAPKPSSNPNNPTPTNHTTTTTNNTSNPTIQQELQYQITHWSKNPLSPLSILSTSQLNEASKHYIQFLIALVMKETKHQQYEYEYGYTNTTNSSIPVHDVDMDVEEGQEEEEEVDVDVDVEYMNMEQVVTENSTTNTNIYMNTTTSTMELKDSILWPPEAHSYIIPLWQHHLHDTKSYRHLEKTILRHLKQEHHQHQLQPSQQEEVKQDPPTKTPKPTNPTEDKCNITMEYIDHCSERYPLQGREVMNVLDQHSYVVPGVQKDGYTRARKELTYRVYSSLGFDVEYSGSDDDENGQNENSLYSTPAKRQKVKAPQAPDNHSSNSHTPNHIHTRSRTKRNASAMTTTSTPENENIKDEFDFPTPQSNILCLKRKRKFPSSTIYHQTFPIYIQARIVQKFALPSIFHLNDSIGHVKSNIEEEFGVPHLQQRLLLHGKELHNTEKLQDHIALLDQVMEENKVGLKLEVGKVMSLCVRDVGFPKKQNMSSLQNVYIETTYQMQYNSKLEKMMNAHAKKKGVSPKHIKFTMQKTGKELEASDTPVGLNLESEEEIRAEYIGNEHMTLVFKDHWIQEDKDSSNDKDGKYTPRPPELTALDVKKSVKLSKLRNMYAQRLNVNSNTINFYKLVTTMKDIKDQDLIMVGPRRKTNKPFARAIPTQSTSEQSTDENEDEVQQKPQELAPIKPITLRVKSQNSQQETYYKIKPYSKFEKVATAYAKRYGMRNSSQFIFFHKARQLACNATISSLDLKENDVICAFKIDHKEGRQGKGSIVVRVKSNISGDEIHFRAKRTTKFHRVVTAYTDREGIPKEHFRFWKGDQLIEDYNKDMSTLGIEDNDRVDAVFIA